jgi:beta-lactamase class D
MHRHARLLVLSAALAGTVVLAAAPKPAPAARFAAYGQPGVFLLQRSTDRTQTVHRASGVAAALADAPRRPASTFKVMLALVALETGALRSADEIVPWTGEAATTRPEWRRDMALREAMQTSSEPFFATLAERIGRERLAAWVTKTGYGNGRIGAVPARVWHDGVLTVTPRQQLLFMDRLRRGALPFEPAHIAAVKAAMRDETVTGAQLYAKTGTHLDEDDTGTAWWIGWVEGAQIKGKPVESTQGATSFALMIELKTMDDRAKRIALGKQLLRDAGVLTGR